MGTFITDYQCESRLYVSKSNLEGFLANDDIESFIKYDEGSVYGTLVTDDVYLVSFKASEDTSCNRLPLFGEASYGHGRDMAKVLKNCEPGSYMERWDDELNLFTKAWKADDGSVHFVYHRPVNPFRLIDPSKLDSSFIDTGDYAEYDTTGLVVEPYPVSEGAESVLLSPE